MNLLTWTNNVAKVGGVEFSTYEEAFGLWAAGIAFPGLRSLQIKEGLKDEAEAKLAAEEIATAIFGSEEVWKLTAPERLDCPTLAVYTASPAMYQDLESMESQRGIWVPLEGE